MFNVPCTNITIQSEKYAINQRMHHIIHWSLLVYLH